MNAWSRVELGILERMDEQVEMVLGLFEHTHEAVKLPYEALSKAMRALGLSR